ncbi:MAG: T9SS type A sorting domain-containing protein [Flavobacteriales bacterium]|nr:T9SS type A sorting domain-containing protein [Flavobacteriales bacterium]
MKRIILLPALLFSGVLAAQSICDSMHIAGIQYAPFGDGFHIQLHNGSTQFFSYPTFEVVDADGDTLNEGFFNFFGIAPGDTQLHQVALLPPLPTSPFTGTLVLSLLTIDGESTCSFDMTEVDLCPTEACIPLQVYAYQQGGSPVTTDLDWSVSDADNTALASGVLHIDEIGFGYAVADLCLAPGAYTLHMAQAVAAGNIIQVGMTQNSFAYTDGTNAQLPIGGSVDHPFNFFAPCADDAQAIATHTPQAPTLVVDGRTLRVNTNDGSALGNMMLLDGTGRVARTITTNASTTFSDLNGFASGIYILRPLDAKNTWPAIRFILN